MLFIPAIDLKSGQCVRLRQGDMNQSTVFAEDPAGVACEWLEQGARRLHLVDLDGAIAGAPKNSDAIQRIVAAVAGRVPIQLGGGVRDLSTIEMVLGWGLQYVILGTAAAQNPAFLREACERFPGRIMAGLDARGGRVAVEGWVRQTELLAVDLAKTMVAAGVSAIVYTDIGRDGMLSGVNVEATKALATAVTLCVFASGGVSSLLDVDLLCDAASSGIAGAIVGRALYDGSLTLTAIQKRVAQRA